MDDAIYLFETCRHLQLRAVHTKRGDDISAWLAKFEQIQDSGLERQYEEWFISRQEEEVKLWNIEQSLRERASLR